MHRLPDGPQAYEEALEQDEQQLTYLVESDSVECFQTRLEGVSYARLPSRRSKAMAGVMMRLSIRLWSFEVS